MTRPDDWTTHRLGELFEFSNGINADKSAYGQGTPFVNVLEVITSESLAVDAIPGRIALPKSTLVRYRVNHGDVLFNRTSETQDEVGLSSTYLGDEPVVFGGFVFRAQPKTAHLDVGYSKYCLRGDDVRSQITGRGQGGIRANIGQRDLKSVVVALPDVPEQRVIAEVLDDASALVDCLQALIEKKRDVKQGMMQELLTGRTRLQGFRDEWQVRTVGEVATVVMGQSPSGSSYNTKAHGVVLIQGNADIENRRSFDRVWTTSPSKRVRKGDVVLTVRAPVGFTARAHADACLGRGVCGLSTTDSTDFLFHALVAAEDKWALFEQGSTFTSVNSDQVRAFEIDWSMDVVERDAIAAVLNDADAEIAALERRLESARAVKVGMMQELLTGRTRLPVKEEA